MYIKRKIDDFLENWKASNSRKPLIVKGPRQVGKTESITRFGEANYSSVIYINFYEDPKYKMITVDGYKPVDIIKNISRIAPQALQDFPEISTALKFFKIDGRYDVICSGSLLDIYYKRIESNSVGYKTDYEMYSLDFEEFLWTKGYGNDTIDDMLAHMKSGTPFNELEMNILAVCSLISVFWAAYQPLCVSIWSTALSRVLLSCRDSS